MDMSKCCYTSRAGCTGNTNTWHQYIDMIYCCMLLANISTLLACSKAGSRTPDMDLLKVRILWPTSRFFPCSCSWALDSTGHVSVSSHVWRTHGCSVQHMASYPPGYLTPVTCSDCVHSFVLIFDGWLDYAVKWSLLSETQSGVWTGCFILKIDRILYAVPVFDFTSEPIFSALRVTASVKNRFCM